MEILYKVDVPCMSIPSEIDRMLKGTELKREWVILKPSANSLKNKDSAYESFRNFDMYIRIDIEKVSC